MTNPTTSYPAKTSLLETLIKIVICVVSADPFPKKNLLDFLAVSAVHKQDAKEEETKNSSVSNKAIPQHWILSPLHDDGLISVCQSRKDGQGICLLHFLRKMLAARDWTKILDLLWSWVWFVLAFSMVLWNRMSWQGGWAVTSAPLRHTCPCGTGQGQTSQKQSLCILPVPHEDGIASTQAALGLKEML